MRVKVEKRINEIEESLKLLAKYMKEESTRLENDIKKGGGEEELSHIVKEIDDIKKRVDEAPSTPSSDLEKKMQAEIKRLEELIYSIPKEKFMKDYSEKFKGTEDLKKGVDLKMQVIESKLKNMANDMVSSKLEDLEAMQEQFKHLEGRVNDTVFILENLKGSNYGEEAKKVEKRLKLRMDEIEEKLNKDKFDSKEYKKVLQEIDEMKEKEKRLLRKEDIKEFKKISDETGERIAEISNKIKHMERKEDFTKTLTEVKNRFDDVDKRLSGAEKAAQNYAKKSDLEDLLGITRRFSGTFATKDDINEIMKDLDEARKTNEKRISLHDVEIRKSLDDIEQFKKDIEKKAAFEDVQTDKIRQRLEDDMNASANKLSLNMQEIRNRIEREAKEFYNSSNTTKVIDDVAQIKQRLESMEGGQNADRDIMDIRVDVDDIDKRLVEIEMNIKDLKKIEIQTKKTLEHVENFDRDIKMETTKLLTAQLAEFAKHVDKRIPAVVSRDEFTQSMIQMNHKISTVESPDMTYVNRRMQALESKVNDIYSLLKSFSNSMPVVVE